MQVLTIEQIEFVAGGDINVGGYSIGWNWDGMASGSVGGAVGGAIAGIPGGVPGMMLSGLGGMVGGAISGGLIIRPMQR